MYKNIAHFLGLEANHTSHAEKIISGLGAFLSIFIIFQISHTVLGDNAYFITASMGAAAVLLFAVPHGSLSQPWPVLAGNVISAGVGVTCAQLIPDTFFAASLAVGASITIMYYLKCLHPPGGATALSAVLGGDIVHEMGYSYMLTPVLLNVLIILSIAFLFNFMFKWRRYPTMLSPDKGISTQKHKLSHQGIEHALHQIDAFIDVNEDDLNRIYQLAREFDQQSLIQQKEP